MKKSILFFVLLFSMTSHASDCNTNLPKNASRTELNSALSCLNDRIDELSSSMLKLEGFKEEIQKPSKWPHAINCGAAWDALFVLHGSPYNNTDIAWYVQVYPNEYRYVQFNADQSFHDRKGHSDSSIGCANKSITQLRNEGRTYEFIQK